MREAFFGTLEEIAAIDRRVCLVVGDLGFGVVERFARRFPDRFVNVGVAEQNMTAIATGLALNGKVVFTYSIGNFATLRCLEQIRNDVCHHDANVKIVAVGGGFAYGALGATHHATEDLAIMRALPGMTVVAPGDPWEVVRATRAVAARTGPCYLRLGRVGEPIVHQPTQDFTIGRAIRVREGRHVTLISTGSLLGTAVAVADRLRATGVEVRVVSMHTIKPLDIEEICAAARETGGIVSIEEHGVLGGLGGAIAEVLAEATDLKVPFKRCGVAAEFPTTAGSQDYMRALCGLSEAALVRTLEAFL